MSAADTLDATTARALHADAVAALTAFAPQAEDQRRLRSEFLDFLAAHPDAMCRSGRPSHLTGSAMIVNAAGTQVLLAMHRKARKWLQMGGHCERGDRLLSDTALREAQEESGLTQLQLLPGPTILDRHGAPCSPEVEHHLDVMWVAVAAAGQDPQLSDESLELAWFDPEQIPEPTDEAVRRLARHAVEQARTLATGSARDHRP